MLELQRGGMKIVVFGIACGFRCFTIWILHRKKRMMEVRRLLRIISALFGALMIRTESSPSRVGIRNAIVKGILRVGMKTFKVQVPGCGVLV